MNLKYQFYRAYYRHFDPRWFGDEARQSKLEEKNALHFEKVNKRITHGFGIDESELQRWRFSENQFGRNLYQFPLRTTYPGLLSGTGYTHETGTVGEVKIGFYFDHTSGLPILPGHSIKGALRAVFPRAGAKLGSTENEEVKKAKAAYILFLLKNKNTTGNCLPVLKESEYAWVQKLESQIFEGAYEGSDGELIHTRRDVFLDAQIVAPERNGKILGLDTITPHKEIWKNPTPLPFLKVLPGVSWEFSFLLHDAVIDGIEIKADQKRELFKLILLAQGAGAKTNVGYGQFESPQTFQKGDLVKAEIIGIDFSNNRVVVQIEGCGERTFQTSRNKIKNFQKGKSILVEIKSLKDDGSVRAVGLQSNKT